MKVAENGFIMFLKQNLFNLCDVFEYIFNNKF